MTRVVLGVIDPMPALREQRKDAVNKNFNTAALDSMQRDQAHAAKRAEAAAILTGTAPSVEFQSEADLRGISPVELATLIGTKPNPAAARELHRQQILAQIEAAQTPPDLDRITG